MKSVISGRMNWLIVTDNVDGKKSIAYCGTLGNGKAWLVYGYGCHPDDGIKHNYNNYYFTYKKDYMEALETFEKG
jgi:hypothetical protein